MRTLNYEKEADRISRWIKEYAKDKGVVLGLSGGVDSSVTAALCSQALGPDHVLGLIMPEHYTPAGDVNDAIEVAEQLGIECYRAPIHGVIQAFRIILPQPEDKIAMGNVRARTRMITLYYYANKMNRLVAGTGDRSESLIGYYTKYGDGGVDFLPIGHLYKTEVRKMAEHLKLPDRIIKKQSSPQLWPGHDAAEELGAPYEQIDPMLMWYFDDHETMRSTHHDDDLMQDMLKKPLFRDLLGRNIATEHKRRMPDTISWGFI